MTDWQTYANARVALEWQIDLGATEAIGDAPVNRYEVVPASKPAPKIDTPVPQSAPPPPQAVEVPQVNAAEIARDLAQAATDLAALRMQLEAFEHCEIRQGARNLVFGDGNPEARVMIIGEAPGADEDKQGLPFVGRAGQLLDKMFAAIDMDRAVADADKALYITNILPWRPPQNRDPSPEEVDMLRPFVRRHVELVNPDVLVLMGNHACHALLGKKGITRLRGNWTEALGKPVMPMFHPAYLLRNPAAKREAWADLLELKSKLTERA